MLCYGRDILAPADGVVVEVGTGCPNSRIDGKSAQCDGSDIRGNYVLIQHAENEFALLAHLKPGSTTVSVGQEVRRFDVIGACGNSGMTSEPHLHFHVQDGRSFYTSAGLPVAFENISVEPFTSYASVYEHQADENAASCYPPYLSKDVLVCNLPSA